MPDFYSDLMDSYMTIIRFRLTNSIEFNESHPNASNYPSHVVKAALAYKKLIDLYGPKINASQGSTNILTQLFHQIKPVIVFEEVPIPAHEIEPDPEPEEPKPEPTRRSKPVDLPLNQDRRLYAIRNGRPHLIAPVPVALAPIPVAPAPIPVAPAPIPVALAPGLVYLGDLAHGLDRPDPRQIELHIIRELSRCNEQASRIEESIIRGTDEDIRGSLALLDTLDQTRSDMSDLRRRVFRDSEGNPNAILANRIHDTGTRLERIRSSLVDKLNADPALAARILPPNRRRLVPIQADPAPPDDKVPGQFDQIMSRCDNFVAEIENYIREDSLDYWNAAQDQIKEFIITLIPNARYVLIQEFGSIDRAPVETVQRLSDLESRIDDMRSRTAAQIIIRTADNLLVEAFRIFGLLQVQLGVKIPKISSLQPSSSDIMDFNTYFQNCDLTYDSYVKRYAPLDTANLRQLMSDMAYTIINMIQDLRRSYRNPTALDALPRFSEKIQRSISRMDFILMESRDIGPYEAGPALTRAGPAQGEKYSSVEEGPAQGEEKYPSVEAGPAPRDIELVRPFVNQMEKLIRLNQVQEARTLKYREEGNKELLDKYEGRLEMTNMGLDVLRDSIQRIRDAIAIKARTISDINPLAERSLRDAIIDREEKSVDALWANRKSLYVPLMYEIEKWGKDRKSDEVYHESMHAFLKKSLRANEVAEAAARKVKEMETQIGENTSELAKIMEQYISDMGEFIDGYSESIEKATTLSEIIELIATYGRHESGPRARFYERVTNAAKEKLLDPDDPNVEKVFAYAQKKLAPLMTKANDGANAKRLQLERLNDAMENERLTHSTAYLAEMRSAIFGCRRSIQRAYTLDDVDETIRSFASHDKRISADFERNLGDIASKYDTNLNVADIFNSSRAELDAEINTFLTEAREQTNQINRVAEQEAQRAAQKAEQEAEQEANYEQKLRRKYVKYVKEWTTQHWARVNQFSTAEERRAVTREWVAGMLGNIQQYLRMLNAAFVTENIPRDRVKRHVQRAHTESTMEAQAIIRQINEAADRDAAREAAREAARQAEAQAAREAARQAEEQAAEEEQLQNEKEVAAVMSQRAITDRYIFDLGAPSFDAKLFDAKTPDDIDKARADWNRQIEQVNEAYRVALNRHGEAYNISRIRLSQMLEAGRAEAQTIIRQMEEVEKEKRNTVAQKAHQDQMRRQDEVEYQYYSRAMALAEKYQARIKSANTERELNMIMDEKANDEARNNIQCDEERRAVRAAESVNTEHSPRTKDLVQRLIHAISQTDRDYDSRHAHIIAARHAVSSRNEDVYFGQIEAEISRYNEEIDTIDTLSALNKAGRSFTEQIKAITLRNKSILDKFCADQDIKEQIQPHWDSIQAGVNEMIAEARGHEAVRRKAITKNLPIILQDIRARWSRRINEFANTYQSNINDATNLEMLNAAKAFWEIRRRDITDAYDSHLTLVKIQYEIDAREIRQYLDQFLAEVTDLAQRVDDMERGRRQKLEQEVEAKRAEDVREMLPLSQAKRKYEELMGELDNKIRLPLKRVKNADTELSGLYKQLEALQSREQFTAQDIQTISDIIKRIGDRTGARKRNAAHVTSVDKNRMDLSNKYDEFLRNPVGEFNWKPIEGEESRQLNLAGLSREDRAVARSSMAMSRSAALEKYEALRAAHMLEITRLRADLGEAERALQTLQFNLNSLNSINSQAASQQPAGLFARFFGSDPPAARELTAKEAETLEHLPAKIRRQTRRIINLKRDMSSNEGTVEDLESAYSKYVRNPVGEFDWPPKAGPPGAAATGGSAARDLSVVSTRVDGPVRRLMHAYAFVIACHCQSYMYTTATLQAYGKILKELDHKFAAYSRGDGEFAIYAPPLRADYFRNACAKKFHEFYRMAVPCLSARHFEIKHMKQPYAILAPLENTQAQSGEKKGGGRNRRAPEGLFITNIPAEEFTKSDECVIS